MVGEAEVIVESVEEASGQRPVFLGEFPNTVLSGILDSREASTTLCGTEMGAEIRSGASYKKDELILNGTRHGQLTHESLSDVSAVAYFEGRNEPPGVVEAKQWIDAILNDNEPVVKPEEAFRVTQILEAIYTSATQNRQVFLD